MRRVINVFLSRVLDINIYMLRSIVLDNSGETRCVCVECQVVGFPVADNDRDPGHEAIRGCFV